MIRRKRYILKTWATGFADGWNVRCEKKRVVEDVARQMGDKDMFCILIVAVIS